MWRDLLVAISLVLVIEGIGPFLNPAGMKRVFMMAQQMSDSTLRVVGLTSMVTGVTLLYLVR